MKDCKWKEIRNNIKAAKAHEAFQNSLVCFFVYYTHLTCADKLQNNVHKIGKCAIIKNRATQSEQSVLCDKGKICFSRYRRKGKGKFITVFCVS